MSKASKMIGASLATTGLMLAFAPRVSADEIYKINEGDTLSQIAARFNSTVDELAKKNKINNPDLIIAGHSITIPDGQTIEVKPTATEAKADVYHVQAGDTLNKIAQQFNISVEKLRSLNHLEGDLILVGQQLRLKAEVEEQVETDKVAAETLETEETTEKAAPIVEVATPSIAISGSTYVVQPGDTLEAIAEAAGLSVSDLQAMNGLTSNFIYAGQVLQVVKDEAKPAPVEAETPEVKAEVAPQVSTPAVQAEAKRQAQAEAVKQQAEAEQQAAAAEQQAQAEAQQKAQAEAEAQQQAQAEAEAQQKAQAEAEAQQKAQAEAEARQKAQAEAEARQKAQAEAQQQAEAEKQAQAQKQAEAEKKAQQEAAAQKQAEAEKKAQQEAAAQKQQNQGNQGQNIVNTAQKYVGTPYVWGGKTPKGFDCSGFTHYVYKEATGKEIGGWTVPQENAGPQIGVNQAQAGDLYFWGAKGSTRHVALATDNQGGYIHAPQPGKTVQNSNVNYYRPDFAVSMAQYR